MVDVSPDKRVVCWLCGKVMQEGAGETDEPQYDYCDACLAKTAGQPAPEPSVPNGAESEPAPFVWTPKRREAAGLVAADRLSLDAIAARVGIGTTTLDRWVAHPAFQLRVQHIAAALVRAATRALMSEKQARVDAKQHRLDLMWQVIKARAEDPDNKAPGHETGLVVQKVRTHRTKGNVITEHEWSVDTGLLAEMRAHETEIAKELLQWVERKQQSGDAEAPLYVKHEGLPALPAGVVLVHTRDLSVETLEALKRDRERNADAG